MTLHYNDTYRAGVAMVDYRLYLFDSKNHIHRRVDLECRDDAHAIEVVGEHAFHGAAELWQRGRLVKRFEPQQT